jgi:hypothetical protein
MATVASLTATLAKYEAARDAVLTTGQSYRIDDREFTRADLAFLESQIERLETKISMASGGGKLKAASAVFGGRS